ncbi:transglycosylase SLT domain-containing protein [Paenibacillus sp. HJL G12]|uniref:Transglycosylase SLT domain-containing protein n=1 Tax=Paenibacillus dendrobii TaxID=2691084 RepID=A0A7X3LJ81_9BACL|nr:lytic transglycosylase domain-containing protein [Paenibacillus dendrobii]MWV45263.1 transglycosylase SLT domain-containing protein [Paenibacillus dendrobii]
MQIDSATAKQLASLQDNSRIQNRDELLQDILENGSSSDFGVILQQLVNSSSDSSASSDGSVLPTVPGVSYSDGLLWQQLGASEKTEASGLQFVNSSHSTGKSGPTAYDDLIQQASRKYGIDESLIKAVIDTESSFNPNVVSSAGAKGLMQLMDGTAAGLGVTDPFDPAQNIDAGTRYLSYQIKRFNGQENMALAAYNAGPNRLAKLGVSTDEQLMDKLGMLPLETRKYIGKIANARSKYEV